MEKKDKISQLVYSQFSFEKTSKKLFDIQTNVVQNQGETQILLETTF